MKNTFRPPAVPLVTVDPYFNIWSKSDQLHESETIHWTGKTNGMVGMAKIDEKVWRFMGGKDVRSDFKSVDAPAMKQTGLEVHALSSVYTFEAGGVSLEVSFTSPLLLDDLDTLSRPVSYVTISACSVDGKSHDLQIYFDMTAECCVDIPLQEVEGSRDQLQDGSPVLRMGTVEQAVLARSGDDLRIDWGYALLVIPHTSEAKTVISDVSLRDRFAKGLQFDEHDANGFPRAVGKEPPVMACLIDYGEVGATRTAHYIALAYDDILSIEYFNKQLPGYWKRNGMSTKKMLQSALQDYDKVMARCDEFNRSLRSQAIDAGGEKYADILSLAYRQAIAAHKLVEDEDGKILFFSKENFSNGCMGTVDVSYPSIPLFLLYNVELIKGMLRPVFHYAMSPEWPYDFAPHDVGRYPIANGQAYGMSIERQMPIEECGNMLIMTTAVCLAEGNAHFASEHWELLTQWVQYLIDHGMDPGNQLCTDDFGGHWSHNANLSIKAIIGIGSYGLLCGMLGDEEKKDSHLKTARQMAERWEEMAEEDDHYKLAFDASGSWSLKYNLVWDELFELGLFPKEIRQKEIAYYLSKINRYGVPLDNRQTYTKADWLIWAATLADNDGQFKQLIEPFWDFLHESPSRVPMTDWYYTIDGRMTGFINRSVVAGLFMKIVSDVGIVNLANRSKQIDM